MTLGEALTKIDAYRPNGYTAGEKIGWISMLDGMAFREVAALHEDAPEEFAGYGGDAGADTVLLVPEPWAEDVYMSWLESRMDRQAGEYTRYNVTSQLFNSAYLAFQDGYNRLHSPRRLTAAFRLR